MKKIKLVSIAVSVVALAVDLAYYNYFQKNNNMQEEKVVEKNKITNKSEGEEKKVEVGDEITENEKKDKNSDDNNLNPKNSIDKTQNAPISKNNSQNSTVNETKTTSTSPNSSVSIQKPTTPQTEWEKLGISEYAYYNTPYFDWETVDFKNNGDCEAYIQRNVAADKYFTGGNYRIVNGKYTYSYIGCMVYLRHDGEKYTYQQAKAMGYN